MDFKQPKTEELTQTVVSAVAGIGGAVVSNIVVSQIIGDKKEGTDEKKLKNKRKMVKGITLLATLAGASFVQGKDTSANAVRNALIGSTIMQGVSLAKEFVSDDEKTSKIAKQAVGLGCPCEGTLNEPLWLTNNSYYTTPYYYTEERIEKPVKDVQPRNVLFDFSE